jgi:hypothetical protein
MTWEGWSLSLGSGFWRDFGRWMVGRGSGGIHFVVVEGVRTRGANPFDSI